MCRGGGEGVGTASLAPFGSLTHLALDWHDYFNGLSGGLDAAGDNWVPSWTATHNQTTASYTGSEAAQARVLQVPLARTRAWGIPLLVGEWGIHSGTPGAAAYQTQMLDLFAKDKVSWTRWVLTGGGFGLLSTDGAPTRRGRPDQAALAASPEPRPGADAIEQLAIRPMKQVEPAELDHAAGDRFSPCVAAGAACRRRAPAQRAAEKLQLDPVAEPPQEPA